MRIWRTRVRLLATALAVVATAAVMASAALATTASSTAHGLMVTASLSPDTVSQGQTVMQTASVKNVSSANERVAIEIIGPQLTPASIQVFVVTLQPSESFSRSTSFPASQLTPGRHRLFVIAQNLTSGGNVLATATVTRT
jgi:uncharacterized protein (DUF58 family)